MPRRRPGTLLPLELDLLEALLAAAEPVHGFALAASIAERDGGALTAHGTLYKALGRMQERGLVTSSWEDKAEATAQGRPPRRCYEVTGEGRAVAHAAAASRAASSSHLLAGGTA
ncbi:PadR family transcriptional regulator [Rathayibacter caricis DSM 15933]|uniref:PadR family transcriptional regulator n=1 Tax=Rathayibacter caricis DSM 15933 TaxID=1328867 RepID=A0A2T4UX43_9MICO|nr:helix-turn-helix transcriptional regulator [Rathayibacter caricis]PTL74104.1 PadR family transcriptional regulator [Rathayibacter caricis DSM 15933]